MAKTKNPTGKTTGLKGPNSHKGHAAGGEAGRKAKQEANKARAAAKKAEAEAKAAAHQAKLAAQHSEFLKKWSSLPSFRTEFGTYRVGDDQMGRAVVQVREGKKGNVVQVCESSCGFAVGLFVDMYLVVKFSEDRFDPNYNLTPGVQTLQSKLHAMVRAAYLENKERRSQDANKQNGEPKNSQPKARAFAGMSKWEAMHKLGTTSRSFSELVHGKQKAYSLPHRKDDAETWAVVCVEMPKPELLIIKMCWAESGHPLHGVSERAFVKIYKLKDESLPDPWGTDEQKIMMQSAQKMHTYLRELGQSLGFKGKASEKLAQHPKHGHRRTQLGVRRGGAAAA